MLTEIETIAQAVAPDPIPWLPLLQWGLTEAGLGAITAGLVWLLTTAYQGHFHKEMPVGLKAGLAFAGPFLVAVVVYVAWVVIGGAQFNAEALGGAIVLAGRMTLDGQAVFNGVKALQKKWDDLKKRWEAKEPKPA